MSQGQIFAQDALLADGWHAEVLLKWDDTGSLIDVQAGAKAGDAPRAALVVPGMPNLHSHAFQRAMAGLAERAGPGEESFWTWREVMYGFLAKLDPDDVEAIAGQLYVEMLKAGYTAVGEFHYLHHGPGGQPYDAPAATSQAIIAAARASGIGLTHLPVLYGYSGFGGKPAGEGQKRFINDPEGHAEIVQAVMAAVDGDPNFAVGIAPHSLRAVTVESLDAALNNLHSLSAQAPVHIHIAEQTKEVEDCLAWSGRRPVEWLLEHFKVDRHWCLVHATHMTAAETNDLAKSEAVAGICPTTEANLGDGFFPAEDYIGAGGLWGIGSDSHISVSPIEELRLFEYGARLRRRRRTVLRDPKGQSDSNGAFLYRAALEGGAQALGRPIGGLAVGRRADFLSLDSQHPLLYGRSGDQGLDAWMFAGSVPLVADVYVGGRQVVAAGHHAKEAEIAARFRKVVDKLSS